MCALERPAGGSSGDAAAPGSHRQAGWLVGIALVAAVTGLIELLKAHAPASGLAVLYLLAVLPAAGVLVSAVAEEVARLLSAEGAFVAQLEPECSFTVLAVGGRGPDIVTGERRQIEPPGPIAAVVRTGRPARVDDLDQASSELKERIRRSGIRSAVVTPI